MSNKLNETLLGLKASGNKITPIRRAILDIFIGLARPLSANDIINRLSKQKIAVHKTTVYRELEFLKDKSFINEIIFNDGQMRYESASEKHHHHVVCLGCKLVKCIDMDNHLLNEEKIVEKKTKFKIKRHALEFYGLCQKCS